MRWMLVSMSFFLLNFIWRIRHTEKTLVFEVGSEQFHYIFTFVPDDQHGAHHRPIQTADHF